MPRVLTDGEIAELLADEKELPANWQSRLSPKPKTRAQYDERELRVESRSGRTFRLICRRNRQNQLDFSVNFVLEDEDGNDYRLVRYNGIHPSKHTNRWEKEQGEAGYQIGPDFHIHRATERYQREGYAIDGFAELTDRYSDFGSARDALLADCGFLEQTPQGRLL